MRKSYKSHFNNVTLSKFAERLNSCVKKKSGKRFAVSDVQGYIRRGHLPKYLGGESIIVNKDIQCIKLYSII